MTNSKYTKWYNAIISQAKNRVNTFPTERHHILPKSLGGTNDVSNIVKLSYREHFLCHLLLTKMSEGEIKRKMLYAFWMMRFGRKTSSTRTYENLKKTSRWYANIKSAMSGKNCYMYGIPKSEEIKKKISLSLSGRTIPTSTIDKRKQTINTPEFKANRYGESWRKISSEMQKGLRACTWTLQDPSGSIHKTKTLLEFCKEHNLVYETIVASWRKQRTISSGSSSGWKVLSKLNWK
jgi:hypothetical protein